MADAGGDMAAAGGDMAAAGGDMSMMMEAMTPAMTMSFLLPGIGLGLLKGMLLGKNHFSKITISLFIYLFNHLKSFLSQNILTRL